MTMTTTAEKIRDIQLALKCAENKLKETIDVINASQIELTKVKSQRIKPADPKPIECWVTKHCSTGKPCGVGVYEYTPGGKKPFVLESAYRSVHMREVTPQDGQDRKDAARYRKSKEISRDTTTLSVANVSQWDRIIDKAMEEE